MKSYLGIPKKKLFHLYCTQGRSIPYIAKKYKVKKWEVRKAITFFGMISKTAAEKQAKRLNESMQIRESIPWTVEQGLTERQIELYGGFGLYTVDVLTQVVLTKVLDNIKQSNKKENAKFSSALEQWLKLDKHRAETHDKVGAKQKLPEIHNHFYVDEKMEQDEPES